MEGQTPHVYPISKQEPAKPAPGERFVCDYPVEPPPVYDYHQPFERTRPPTPRAHRLLEFTLLGDGKHQLAADVVKTGQPPGGSAARNELLQDRDFHRDQTPWVARLSVKLSDQRTETDTLRVLERGVPSIQAYIHAATTSALTADQA